jgi:hypothetical protein
VNRTHIKIGDPRKTLSHRLGETPSASQTHAGQVFINGHMVGSFVPNADGFQLQVTNANVRYRIS